MTKYDINKNPTAFKQWDFCIVIIRYTRQTLTFIEHLSAYFHLLTIKRLM